MTTARTITAPDPQLCAVWEMKLIADAATRRRHQDEVDLCYGYNANANAEAQKFAREIDECWKQRFAIQEAALTTSSQLEIGVFMAWESVQELELEVEAVTAPATRHRSAVVTRPPTRVDRSLRAFRRKSKAYAERRHLTREESRELRQRRLPKTVTSWSLIKLSRLQRAWYRAAKMHLVQLKTFGQQPSIA